MNPKKNEIKQQPEIERKKFETKKKIKKEKYLKKKKFFLCVERMQWIVSDKNKRYDLRLSDKSDDKRSPVRQTKQCEISFVQIENCVKIKTKKKKKKPKTICVYVWICNCWLWPTSLLIWWINQ